MEQIVKVRRTYPNGTAQVIHLRQSACSGDCHKCSGCGAAQEAVIFTASNPIGADTGDLVKVESQTAPVLQAAVVLYCLPLVLFFLGYYLGSCLANPFGPWGAGLGFLAGVAGVVVYDRCVMRKKEITYTITAFAQSAEGTREEDHHG